MLHRELVEDSDSLQSRESLIARKHGETLKLNLRFQVCYELPVRANVFAPVRQQRWASHACSASLPLVRFSRPES